MRFLTALVLVTATLFGSREVYAQEESKANVGQACSARSDCSSGLKCSQNICVDAKTFEERLPPAGDIDKSDTPRAFLGLSIGGVLPVTWGGAGVGFQGAVRFGALVGDVQFQLEVAPATTAVFGLGSTAMSLFDATGSVAYFIRISDMVSWILRVGGGGGAVFGASPFLVNSVNPTTDIPTFAEFRADLFGVAVRTSRHLLVEFNAPSFRMMFFTGNSSNNFMTMWVTNVTINYVF